MSFIAFTTLRFATMPQNQSMLTDQILINTEFPFTARKAPSLCVHSLKLQVTQLPNPELALTICDKPQVANR